MEQRVSDALTEANELIAHAAVLLALIGKDAFAVSPDLARHLNGVGLDAGGLLESLDEAEDMLRAIPAREAQRRADDVACGDV